MRGERAPLGNRPRQASPSPSSSSSSPPASSPPPSPSPTRWLRRGVPRCGEGSVAVATQSLRGGPLGQQLCGGSTARDGSCRGPWRFCVHGTLRGFGGGGWGGGEDAQAGSEPIPAPHNKPRDLWQAATVWHKPCQRWPGTGHPQMRPVLLCGQPLPPPPTPVTLWVGVRMLLGSGTSGVPWGHLGAGGWRELCFSQSQIRIAAKAPKSRSHPAAADRLRPPPDPAQPPPHPPWAPPSRSSHGQCPLPCARSPGVLGG